MILSRIPVHEALANCEQWLKGKKGNLPKEVWMPVLGLDGDESGNAMAKFFHERGIIPRGVRYHEHGHLAWLHGRPDTPKNLGAWCALMWCTLPLNAECAPALKYKQTWDGERWRTWKPEPEKEPGLLADAPAWVPMRSEAVKARFLREADSFGNPESAIMAVFDPEGDEVTNELAQWAKQRGLQMFGVRVNPLSYGLWLEGRADTPPEIDEWAICIWENLPRNAQIKKGISYKLVWTNDGWQDWQPEAKDARGI